MSSAWHDIRDHLMRSSSTHSFQRRFDTIRRARNPITPFHDAVALLDWLHRGGSDPERKNLILSELVEEAQCDGPAAGSALTLLLLALWPGLDAIKRRSLWRKMGFADEIASDVLAQATEAIRRLDLNRVQRIAATVLRNVERDIIRARQRDVVFRNIDADTDMTGIAAEAPALGSELIRRDLVRLVGSDAALVQRVAIDGFSQAEAAVEFNLTEAAARKRYQRASQRLRELFHQEA